MVPLGVSNGAIRGLEWQYLATNGASNGASATFGEGASRGVSSSTASTSGATSFDGGCTTTEITPVEAKRTVTAVTAVTAEVAPVEAHDQRTHSWRGAGGPVG